MTVTELERRLRAAWSRDTSYTPGAWSPERPSTGQCAVTALLVHDETGAKILKTRIVSDVTHFYNELDGRRLDLTLDQYAEAPNYQDLPVDPEALRTHPSTVPRYAILRQRFEDATVV